MFHFKSKKSSIIVQWAQNVDLHCCTNPLPKVQSVVMKLFVSFLVCFKLLFWLKSGMNKAMLTFLLTLDMCYLSLGIMAIKSYTLRRGSFLRSKKPHLHWISTLCTYTPSMHLSVFQPSEGCNFSKAMKRIIRKSFAVFPLQLDYSASYYWYFLAEKSQYSNPKQVGLNLGKSILPPSDLPKDLCFSFLSWQLDCLLGMVYQLSISSTYLTTGWPRK